MAVMAAGVHHALGPGSIWKIAGLFDRQRIHVGAKTDDLGVAVASGFLACDDADHASFAYTGDDIVTSEFAQELGNKGGRTMFVKGQFGMSVKVMAPSLDFRQEFSNTIYDGHGTLLCYCGNRLRIGDQDRHRGCAVAKMGPMCHRRSRSSV